MTAGLDFEVHLVVSLYGSYLFRCDEKRFSTSCGLIGRCLRVQQLFDLLLCQNLRWLIFKVEISAEQSGPEDD